MLEASEIVAFVATVDLVRARAFYAHTLGLPIVSEDSYACTVDARGTHLRLTPVEEIMVAPYTVLGWSVIDVDATIRSLVASGVTFERFGGMDQDELGVWRAPNGARVAWFKDPDGHTLSITQNEATTQR